MFCIKFIFLLKLFRFWQNILTVDTCAWHSLENGEVDYDKQRVNDERYPIDTVATYTCNTGYSQSGSSSRTCQNSGNWEPALPTCNEGNKKSYYNWTLPLIKS